MVLAAQLKSVDYNALLHAADAWALRPNEPFTDLLVRRGLLSNEDAIVLRALSVQQQEKQPSESMQPLRELDSCQPAHRNTAQFQDTYSKLSTIGTGGMGRVSLAIERKIGRKVALKELCLDIACDRDGTTLQESLVASFRFLREARITGQLEHPSIVPVYELGQSPDGAPFYTMKYVRGVTLSKAIEDAPDLRRRLALLPKLLQVCHAIAFAHSKGVIHRDIKPDNIMIGEFGETILLDWGVAKVKAEEDIDPNLDLTSSNEDGQKTLPGTRIGTPGYMSPEQAAGRTDDVDEQTDVFALGAVMYEVLCGEAPFSGVCSNESIELALASSPRPVCDRVPGLPAELAFICTKAISREKSARFNDAGEMARALQEFLTGSLVGSYRYSPRELIWHYFRRHKRSVLGACATVLLVIFVTVVAFWRVTEARNAEAAARRIAEFSAQEAQERAYVAQLRLTENYLRAGRPRDALSTLRNTEPGQRKLEWHHLMSHAAPQSLSITNVEGKFRDAVYSEDGRFIATISWPHSLQLWGTQDGALQNTFAPARTRYNCVAFNSSASRVAAGGESGLLRVWSVEDATVQLEGRFGDEIITDIYFLSDGSLVVVASLDAYILSDIGKIHGQIAFMGATDGSAVLEDTVLAVSGGGEVQFLRTNDLTLLAKVRGRFCSASPDGTRIAAVEGNVVSVFGAAGDLHRQLQIAPIPLNKMAWSEDASLLAATGGSNVVFVWEVQSGRLMHSLEHMEPVDELAFSPVNEQLLTSAGGRHWKLWDAAFGKVLASKVWSSGNKLRVGFSPSGDNFFTTALDEHLDIWSYRSIAANQFELPCSGLEKATYDPATGATVSLSSGGIVLTREKDQPVKAVAVVADSPGTFFCSTSSDSVTYSPDSRSLVKLKLPGSTAESFWASEHGVLTAVCEHRPNSLLGIAHWDGNITLLDAATLTPIENQSLAKSAIRTLAFSGDGTVLYAGGEDGTVYAWPCRGPGLQVKSRTLNSPVTAMLCHRDVIYIGTLDGLVHRLFPDSLELSGEFSAGQGHVQSIFELPDKRVGLLKDDGRLNLCNESGQLLVTIDEENDPIVGAWFEANVNSLVCAFRSGRFQYYPADPQLVQGAAVKRDESGEVNTYAVSYPSLKEGAREDLRRLQRDFATISNQEVSRRLINNYPCLGLAAGDLLDMKSILALDPVSASTAQQTIPSSVSIRRSEIAFNLSYVWLDPRIYEKEIFLSRGDLVEMLEYEVRLLEEHFSKATLGEPAAGYTIQPAGPLSAQYLRAVGLSPFDTVVSVEGQRINDAGHLARVYEELLVSLKQRPEINTVQIKVKRGIFQTLHISIKLAE